MNQIQFRRQALDLVNPTESTNAGLWLDKYLLNDNDDAKKNLVMQVFDEIKISSIPICFFVRINMEWL